MSTSSELAGKVAIVTGAGRNIGRAIAHQLAQAGAAVVVNAGSNKTEADAVVREIEAAGGKALAVLGDVGDAKVAAAMADAALKHFGRIDILVNNAALRREKAIYQMTYDDWREVMNVILDGAFRCVHACLPAIQKSGGGTIINIGGMSAHIGSKHRAHVMTAKAAMVGFSRALAHDLAADHITANCVVPGAIEHHAVGRFQAGAPSHPRHHQWRAWQAGRRRRHGAFPVRPRRALCHRADHPRQWRRLSRRITAWRGGWPPSIESANLRPKIA